MVTRWWFRSERKKQWKEGVTEGGGEGSGRNKVGVLDLIQEFLPSPWMSHKSFLHRCQTTRCETFTGPIAWCTQRPIFSQSSKFKLPSLGYQGHCGLITISNLVICLPETLHSAAFRRLSNCNLCCFPSQERQPPMPVEERDIAFKEKEMQRKISQEEKKKPLGELPKMTLL